MSEQRDASLVEKKTQAGSVEGRCAPPQGQERQGRTPVATALNTSPKDVCLSKTCAWGRTELECSRTDFCEIHDRSLNSL
eukprot:637869-Pelagomonas_calceolata.AAC.6